MSEITREQVVDYLSNLSVMDIAALKQNFGRELTFWGGVGTQRVLPYGTPEEVRAEAERTIGIMAPGGGYVLGASQAIQGDVPPENILAMVDTVDPVFICKRTRKNY